ncbi:shikimate dehydrogenase [Kocuria sp. SL71]|uniref:shikimate dehydrogenase n=1 Tax=Kocuria sp. SL71 TaxID=2995151 RepID=UPI00045EB893|nr:shikimate dehydrogenase [Kocuria sp. SL71]MCY1683502.1 shikimate dehydrogenase [Kocuria sp. SL71]
MSTAHAGVAGHPIGHSLSPRLHEAAYRVLGEAIDYRAYDLEEGELTGQIALLRQDPAWQGMSVTMPLKSEAAELADELSDQAAAVGTVNTLRPRSDGSLLGHNSDVAGIAASLRAAGAVPEGARASVLGGGGTATAALAALQQLGAEEIELWVRSPQRAGRAVEAAERLGLPLRIRDWDAAAEHLAGSDLVVSTLPPHGADDLAAQLASVPGRSTGGTLLDAAYDPWPSALARGWQRAGGTVVPGLDMLVLQALDQIRLFTGRSIDQTLPQEHAVIRALCTAAGRPELAEAVLRSS